MDCKRAEQFISMYVDHELDAAAERELREHLDACPPCQREALLERGMKTLVSAHARRAEAPRHLLAQIRTSFQTPPPSRSWWTLLQDWREWYPVRTRFAFATAAVALITALSFTVSGRMQSQPSQTPPVILAELVKHHTKCALQVTSDEPAAVKAWFSGRVQFTVDVPQLDRVHSRLQGAHICQAENQDLVYLVYDDQGVRVSICTLDGAQIDMQRFKRTEVNGQSFYLTNCGGLNLVFWLDGKQVYSCISSLQQVELITMAQEARSHRT